MSTKEEKTYEIIRACVPEGTTPKLARAVGRSSEQCNSWTRPPPDDEALYGTGIINPMDWVEAIQDHAFAHAPREAHRIYLYYKRRHDLHFAHGSFQPLSRLERDKELSDVVREHAELLQCVLTQLPAHRVRKEWEDLKRECEELVAKIENGVETEPSGKAKWVR